MDNIFMKPAPACYQVLCSADGSSYEVFMQDPSNGNAVPVGVCAADGQALFMDGFQGGIYCASPAELCSVQPPRFTLGAYNPPSSTSMPVPTSDASTAAVPPTGIVLGNFSLNLSSAAQLANFKTDPRTLEGLVRGVAQLLQSSVRYVQVIPTFLGSMPTAVVNYEIWIPPNQLASATSIQLAIVNMMGLSSSNLVNSFQASIQGALNAATGRQTVYTVAVWQAFVPASSYSVHITLPPVSGSCAQASPIATVAAVSTCLLLYYKSRWLL